MSTTVIAANVVQHPRGKECLHVRVVWALSAVTPMGWKEGLFLPVRKDLALGNGPLGRELHDLCSSLVHNSTRAGRDKKEIVLHRLVCLRAAQTTESSLPQTQRMRYAALGLNSRAPFFV